MNEPLMYVFPDHRGDSHLRTTLEKIILRAGVTPWPKLWQNLRASAATDLARTSSSRITQGTSRRIQARSAGGLLGVSRPLRSRRQDAKK
ncbi:MAG: hypothetical protein ACK480_10850, partial [Planctomycetota bacterium]